LNVIDVRCQAKWRERVTNQGMEINEVIFFSGGKIPRFRRERRRQIWLFGSDFLSSITASFDEQRLRFR
jgi:hypothetical protein